MLESGQGVQGPGDPGHGDDRADPAAFRPARGRQGHAIDHGRVGIVPGKGQKEAAPAGVRAAGRDQGRQIPRQRFRTQHPVAHTVQPGFPAMARHDADDGNLRHQGAQRRALLQFPHQGVRIHCQSRDVGKLAGVPGKRFHGAAHARDERRGNHGLGMQGLHGAGGGIGRALVLHFQGIEGHGPPDEHHRTQREDDGLAQGEIAEPKPAQPVQPGAPAPGDRASVARLPSSGRSRQSWLPPPVQWYSVRAVSRRTRVSPRPPTGVLRMSVMGRGS